MESSSNAWQRSRNWAMSSKAPAECARCAGRSEAAARAAAVRVIYFHVVAQAQARLLLIYRKVVKDDLTAAEKKVLRKLNADW